MTDKFQREFYSDYPLKNAATVGNCARKFGIDYKLWGIIIAIGQ
jgi:hypothetical protein